MLSHEDLETYRNMSELFDRDCSGYHDQFEIVIKFKGISLNVSRASNVNFSLTIVLALIRNWVINDDGKISRGELVRSLCQVQRIDDAKEVMIESQTIAQPRCLILECFLGEGTLSYSTAKCKILAEKTSLCQTRWFHRKMHKSHLRRALMPLILTLLRSYWNRATTRS